MADGVAVVLLVEVRVTTAIAVGAQLTLQSAEVGVQLLVLQPTGDLCLLGLGPAAPHRVDPLAQTGATSSLDALVSVRMTSTRRDNGTGSEAVPPHPVPTRTLRRVIG